MPSFSIVRLRRWVRGRTTSDHPIVAVATSMSISGGASSSPILHRRVIGAVVVSRWVQVEPDHVAQLGFQLRVGGELECLDPVRLDVPLAPDPGHRANEIPSRSAINRADQCDAPRCAGGLPMLGSRSPAFEKTAIRTNQARTYC